MAMAPGPSLAQVYASPVAVAVWEWQDGLGSWHPYSAAVCSYIEQQFVQQKGQRFGLGSLAHSIPLGQADPSLAPYIIDLPNWTQFRQDTAPPSPVAPRATPGAPLPLCPCRCRSPAGSSRRSQEGLRSQSQSR